MTIFDGSEREIGKGAQAKVYAYKGNAYKVYNRGYPAQWISFERKVQEEVNRTNLPVVKYEGTEDPHIIKMELIDGVTLGDRIQTEGYKKGIQDLVELQKMVHSVTNLALPTLREYAFDILEKLDTDLHAKINARRILDEIVDTNNLLHLDFHFLNVMYTGEKYYIIDWINARLGNPVFDFARTFVLLNEISPCIAENYLTEIFKDSKFNTKVFWRAVYVMALLRLKESKSEKTINLLREVEKYSLAH